MAMGDVDLGHVRDKLEYTCNSTTNTSHYYLHYTDNPQHEEPKLKYKKT
jgi:hypothetical protein